MNWNDFAIITLCHKKRDAFQLSNDIKTRIEFFTLSSITFHSTYGTFLFHIFNILNKGKGIAENIPIYNAIEINSQKIVYMNKNLVFTLEKCVNNKWTSLLHHFRLDWKLSCSPFQSQPLESHIKELSQC